MKKEKTITISVLVILVAVLIYALTLINKPGGDFIKNLTEPPKNNQTNNQTQMTITPQPGDEKLVKKDIIVGKGDEVKAGDTVSVNYIGTLENGTKFDSSYDRKQSFEFTVGEGRVIRGWELGLLGMKVGGKRELVIPYQLGYGEEGNPPVIPPKATLKFTIELLGIKNVGQEKINVTL